MPNDSEISPQLRKGLLSGSVLAVLAQHEEAYGLQIAGALQKRGPLLGGEGTLYPLLARMRKEGLVDTRWVPSTQGPARRYYFLTDQGKVALIKFRSDWEQLKNAIDPLLLGD